MECKFICKGETNGTRKELIDTLWNVNYGINPEKYRTILELIDTLWNVNALASRIRVSVSGINRYIMECKSPCPRAAPPTSALN